MPGIEAETSPILELMTGADVMVSPFDGVPAMTEKLVVKHLNAGAMLIQRKTHCDLASSVGYRLNESLARMIVWTTRPSQRVLLFIGILEVGVNGEAIVNGNTCDPPLSWKSAQGAIDKWCDRGGVYRSLPESRLVGEWLAMQEQHLREYVDQPIKYVFPNDVLREIDLSDPAQQLITVKDWRRTVATLPGIGPELAGRIFESSVSFGVAMMFLTDPEAAGLIKGIGPKTIQNIRDYLNLRDGELICAAPEEGGLLEWLKASYPPK